MHLKNKTIKEQHSSINFIQISDRIKARLRKTLWDLHNVHTNAFAIRAKIRIGKPFN